MDTDSNSYYLVSMEPNHFEKMESYIPMDLLTLEGFLLANGVILFFVIVRYFALVGLFYGIFWNSKRSRDGDLHDKKIKSNQVAFEIRWSLISSIVFSFSGYALGVLWQKGWTQIYLPFDEWTLAYLPMSFLIGALVHEFYFYWTHRAMHHPKLYRRIHAIHHHSVKTTPWASFSFHPWEALVHASFLPLLALVIPLHPTVIIAYLMFMTLTALSNHLGVELIPFSSVLRWFISGTHHAIHHRDFHYNYGLYFCFIDQWFGTEKLTGKDSELVVHSKAGSQRRRTRHFSPHP